MNLTRRFFTQLLFLFVSTRAFARQKADSFLRPPGAVAESDFLARCNRCQRCVQVCPTKVIMPAGFGAGVLTVNTPVVTFNRSYCNSCMKCTQVCPTSALTPTAKEEMDIGVAEIIKADCVAWDWVGCTVCVDKCPLKAIVLDEGKKPVIDAVKCNGCGICQHECPSTSLRVAIKGKGVIVVPRSANIPPREVIYEN